MSKQIPNALRVAVWNTYIGQQHGQSECWVGCKSLIYQSNFECGHIISKKCGGLANLENLRPICATCNRSIGSKNMEEFKNEHNLKTPSCYLEKPTSSSDVLIEVELETLPKNIASDGHKKKKIIYPESCTVETFRTYIKSCSRDELQSICKMNQIKANITTENMITALEDLHDGKLLNKELFLKVEHENIESHNIFSKNKKATVILSVLCAIICVVIFIMIFASVL